jgi:hypothetical protein
MSYQGRSMAFQFVFLDESGHFSYSDYICLAGLMATDQGWGALCEEWRFLLDEKWKLPAIHMREIMSPLGKSPAASWPKERKEDMLRDFILSIRKHTYVGFGCALDAKHYREVVENLKQTADEQRQKLKPFKAQTFCAARVMRLIMNYLDHIKASEYERKIALIFDDDEQYSKWCYSILCNLKKRVPLFKETMVSITFADDIQYYPLQAADILSYASCNELKKGQDAWSDSGVFTELLKDIDPNYYRVYLSELWTDDEHDTEKLRKVILPKLTQPQSLGVLEDKGE